MRRILRLSGESLLRAGTIDTSGILCRVSAAANGLARVERVEDPWLEGWILRNRAARALIDFVEGWETRVSICVELAVSWLFSSFFLSFLRESIFHSSTSQLFASSKSFYDFFVPRFQLLEKTG